MTPVSFAFILQAMKTPRIWATLDPFLEPGDIMGRTVANAGFLTGLLQADPFDGYHFFPRDPANAKHLQDEFSKVFPYVIDKLHIFPRKLLGQALAEQAYYCFHLSDCIANPAWLARARNAFSRELFPITSFTHSLSYPRYPQEFLAHLWPGTTPRDVVCASSHAGKKVVQSYFSHLRKSYGLDRTTHPEPAVRVVPLGIDAASLQPVHSQKKTALRRKWSMDDNAAVVLAFGRLAHHSKMDLLPVLRVMHRLLHGSHSLQDRPLVLTLAGWTGDKDDYPATLQELAGNMGLDLRLVRRPDEEQKRELFGVADVFFSPADNLQETFGLTLAEAGAMGLPVVASEYDGYRDIIEDGVTGRLIPTMGFDSSDMETILAPLLADSWSHLRLAQATVVDIPAAAAALYDYLKNPEKARQAGLAGRKRVLQRFDWRQAIRQWTDLWDELWTLPVDARGLRSPGHPLAADFAAVFAHHPTQPFNPAALLRQTTYGAAAYRSQDHFLIYAGLDDIITPETVRRLLLMARKPVPAGAVSERLQQECGLTLEQANRHILWAVKHDLLARESTLSEGS